MGVRHFSLDRSWDFEDAAQTFGAFYCPFLYPSRFSEVEILSSQVKKGTRGMQFKILLCSFGLHLLPRVHGNINLM